MFLGTDRLPWHCSGQVLRYRAQHHYSDAATQPLGAPYQRQGNISSIMDMNCLRLSHLTLLSWKSTKEQKRSSGVGIRVGYVPVSLLFLHLYLFASCRRVHTCLRPTSSMKRWWWPAKCTTCVSWDRSFTACAMGRTRTASTVESPVDVSWGLKSLLVAW